MKRILVAFSCIAFILQALDSVSGHARLIDPPSRSSMWRFGFDNPKDYQDNEGFCGGFSVQWNSQNEGRCGVCGDQADLEIREHEGPGGKYANGIIVKGYSAGQVVNVTVDVTANHKGFFTFRICPNNDINQDQSQDCFDQPEHLLKVLPDLTDSFTLPSDDVGKYKVSVKLPEQLECEQCVLQWTYTAGNNWGWCSEGVGDVGCGPQETFRACADISIGHETVGSSEEELTLTGDPEVTEASGSASSTTEETPTLPPASPATHVSETSHPTSSTSEEAPSTPPATTPGDAASSGECFPVGPYIRVPGMADWCNLNCHWTPSFCPPSHCACL